VPCQREHPELTSFQNRHAQTGDATVLAVVFDDDVASVRRFFAREGGDWPVLDDPGGKIALDFGVRGPPESYLIDPSGFVISKIVGEVRAASLDDLVARATRGAK
jgi:cytochrome c biogenesis protein CcmG/thiol:disulfide interchange protein DsbE